MYCWTKMPNLPILNVVCELCCQKQNYRLKSCLRPSLQSTNSWVYKLLMGGSNKDVNSFYLWSYFLVYSRNPGVPSSCCRNQLAGLSFFCKLHGSDCFHLGRGREITVAVQCTAWKRCHCVKQLVFTRHLLFTIWHFTLHSNLHILSTIGHNNLTI